MPSKKIIGVLIVCLGIIASVYIIDHKFSTKGAQSTDSIIAEVTKNTNTYNWQDLLSDATSSDRTIILVSDENAPSTDDNTLTGKLAKDFMAQYLILKNQNGQITETDTATIVESTLSAGDYTHATGTVYTEKNLHISAKSDDATVIAYRNTLTQSMLRNSTEKYESVQVIVERAVKSEKESDLKKLDPIITLLQNMVKDLQTMTIPHDAIDAHLAYLNSLSNILANVQGLRLSLSDPVKSFSALSLYDQHAQDIVSALKELDMYFRSKQ